MRKDDDGSSEILRAYGTILGGSDDAKANDRSWVQFGAGSKYEFAPISFLWFTRFFLLVPQIELGRGGELITHYEADILHWDAIKWGGFGGEPAWETNPPTH